MSGEFKPIVIDDKQRHMAQIKLDQPRNWDQSKPGTGKTIGCILAYHEGVKQGIITGKAVVFAPLSILDPSWGDDIAKFNMTFGTDYKVSIAYAGKKRLERLMDPDADFVITNHDAVKFCFEHLDQLREAGYQWMIIDEATAFKNHTTQRTKAMFAVATLFERRTAMSGTPNAKTNMDLWAPTFILDGGDRLGRSFYKFRQQVADPVQNGPDPNHVVWIDKPEATEVVAQALADITVRYELEIDAHNEVVTYYTSLPNKVLNAYEQMKDQSVIMTEDGEIVSAVNAGVRTNKLLQILSGCVYDSEGKAHVIHTNRVELVMEQVLSRDHSLVAFNWDHELAALEKQAKKHKLRYGVIKGGVPVAKRTEIMHEFQAGNLDVVFAHPKSAGHGLTFTRGTAVIWCSPCNSPESFQQFNQRVHRRGQTQDNQIIRIASKGTKEADVYDSLDSDLTRAEDLLNIMTGVTLAAGAEQ